MAFHLGRHARHRTRIRVIQTMLLILLVMMLLYPFIEPYTLSVHTTHLESTDIPSSLRTLRIVYLSDLHTGSWPFYSKSRLTGLVRKINAQNPDLVILGGDYADTPEGTEAFFRALPTIRSNYGIYAVLGEHDRSTDTEQMNLLRAAMVAKNVTPLINDVVSVRVGTDTIIQIAGLDDVTEGDPTLTALSAKCQNERFVIFACHNPKMIQDAQLAVDANGRRNWFDLGLFGHTHGGQNILFRKLLNIAPNVPDEYMHGIMTEGRATLIISNGIGTSVVPMRLLCPPEIHVITVSYPS